MTYKLQHICRPRSAQLQDGRLVFTADTTKNRSECYAIVPARPFAELQAYAGPTYLSERYPADLVVANNAKGISVHRQSLEFSPGASTCGWSS